MIEIEMGEANEMQIWMNDKWLKYKLGKASDRQTQVNERLEIWTKYWYEAINQTEMWKVNKIQTWMNEKVNL